MNEIGCSFIYYWGYICIHENDNYIGNMNIKAGFKDIQRHKLIFNSLYMFYLISSRPFSDDLILKHELSKCFLT